MPRYTPQWRRAAYPPPPLYGSMESSMESRFKSYKTHHFCGKRTKAASLRHAGMAEQCRDIQFIQIRVPPPKRVEVSTDRKKRERPREESRDTGILNTEQHSGRQLSAKYILRVGNTFWRQGTDT